MKKRWSLVVALGCALAQLPSASNAAVHDVPCGGSSGGPKGLADAITEANSTPATADTIRLAPGCVYTLNAQNDDGSTFTGSIGPANLPRIITRITILGRGAALVQAESSAGERRIINVGDSGNLTLARIKVRGADYTGLGGAVYNDSGRLKVSHSSFSGNTSLTAGGAIFSKDDLVVRNSTFSRNQAGNPGATTDTYGGAIYSGNDTTIVNSTFYDNEVISGSYGGYGGAVTQQGDITIKHSTFADNASEYGSALYNLAGSFIVKNSVLSGDVNVTGNLCGGSTMTGSDNILFDNKDDAPPTCPGTEGDPRLGELQDNGGYTKTMALRAGSAAIAHVPQAKCAARDQRNLRRPTTGKCDAGAFEKNPL